MSNHNLIADLLSAANAGPHSDLLREAAAALSASDAQKQEQRFGCHVDLGPDDEPDGCVLDDGRPDDCRIACRLHAEGKGKEACPEWRPVSLYTAPQPAAPAILSDIEQYRQQMAGISTAALGYWKEGDSIHPDYDTPALREVAQLYTKYESLAKAAAPVVPAEDTKRMDWLDTKCSEGNGRHLFCLPGTLRKVIDHAMLAAAPEVK